MCCFSKPVELVTNTNIFARPSDKGRQFVVYSMKLSAKEDLAMILPIPTPANSAEDAVKFISLKEYENFFEDLDNGFPKPPPPAPVTREPVKEALQEVPKLVVVEVGSFEASFVPSVTDFSRLDERFRLPTTAWEKLPAYKKFGFAVFKLKSGEKKIHPMAFEFPNAVDKIFFPTVHIHDGKVHDKDVFDHVLYLQPASAEVLLPDGWEESTQPASMFMNIKKSAELFKPDMHCYRKGINGLQKNQDTLV